MNPTVIPDPPVLPRPVQSFFEQYPVVREWLAGGAVPTRELLADARTLVNDVHHAFGEGRCSR